MVLGHNEKGESVNVEMKRAVIIGAGPAGLTAGVELLKAGQFQVAVLERDDVVGGLARTNDYKGYRFDIGPHHFITDSDVVMQWWLDIMGDDFHPHKRYTRIFYNKHFFHYPLEPINAITGLSLLECIKCVFSYVKVRIFPIKKVKSFQDWMTNRFGYRLFSIFFKTYSEKVWGIKCTEISADWAAQRIKNFSLSKAIFYAFFGRFFKKNVPRTIQDTFYYPSRGAGTLWERVAIRLKNLGGTISLKSSVTRIRHADFKILDVLVGIRKFTGDEFLSTMPLKDLVARMDPLPPEDVVTAAAALQYRGLITVNLVVDRWSITPDHWLYIHEKSVRMGRIGNMNNFSLKMVANPEHTGLSLEYFTYVTEPFWSLPDKDLVKLGAEELEKIGLVKATEVLDGVVVRAAEAYPVYDQGYLQHLTTVLNYLKQFKNLHLMGRNGMHRYNNMDIAMLSAMEVVDTIKEKHGIQIKKDAVVHTGTV